MRENRVAKELNPLLSKRLAVYALAGAAGLAVSTAKDANADIVYTSARQFGEGTGSDRVVIPIDLNHDGTVDFSLRGGIRYDSLSGFGLHTAYVAASPNNGGIATSAGHYFAGALVFGQKIGPSLPFQMMPSLAMAVIVEFPSGRGSHFGNFYNQNNRFLGLRFEIDGATYYGWARVNVRTVFVGRNPGKNFVFELVDYAYQDRANTPLRAGEGIPLAGADLDLDAEPKEPTSGSPATLGLLAFGSDAISAWRR